MGRCARSSGRSASSSAQPCSPDVGRADSPVAGVIQKHGAESIVELCALPTLKRSCQPVHQERVQEHTQERIAERTAEFSFSHVNGAVVEVPETVPHPVTSHERGPNRIVERVPCAVQTWSLIQIAQRNTSRPFPFC